MKILLWTSLLSVLFACSSKKNISLESIDAQTKAHVLVQGEKANAVEPYQVNILVEAYGMKENVGIEIYAGSLDSSNVKFDWREPGVCLITFKQQDNTERKIVAVALEKKIGLKEIGLEQ